ncbi:MAG: hypothetical protein K1X44_02895 [Alphaproteobacteria bacterium]|nr:hypothetical protein [Alphaproteobacteria bacterium]
MTRSLIFSGIMHVVILILLIFGLPTMYTLPELEPVMVVQVVTDSIDKVTTQANKPGAQTKKNEEKPSAPEPEKPVVKPVEEPEKPAPSPVTTPPPSAETTPTNAPEPTPAKPEESLPEPTPKEDIKPVPVPQKKPDIKPKEEVKKIEPKKDQKKTDKPVPDQLSSVLKNLEKRKREQSQDKNKDSKSQPTPQPPTDASEKSEAQNSGNPVTQGEKDAIMQQIRANWFIDAGAKDIETFEVIVLVWLQPDGTVSEVKVESDARFESYPAYKSFVEGARRAVLKSSPLKLPPGRYNDMKALELHFTPQDMF